MSSNLLTSYGEYDAAIDLILSRAERQLDIFDHDLSLLKLERPARQAALERLLAAPNHQLRIVVQDGQTVLARQPRLVQLLSTHGHHLSLIEADEKLQNLTDSFLIADHAHALVRFHRDQPRSKLLECEAEEVKPYERRFLAILEEGGTALSPRVAGL